MNWKPMRRSKRDVLEHQGIRIEGNIILDFESSENAKVKIWRRSPFKVTPSIVFCQQ